MSPALAPPAPVAVPAVEPRDCLTCGGIHPAAIGRCGYRYLTCKSEYVTADTEARWRTR